MGKNTHLFRGAKYLLFLSVSILELDKGKKLPNIADGLFWNISSAGGNFCFVENLNTSRMKISDLDKSEKL